MKISWQYLKIIRSDDTNVAISPKLWYVNTTGIPVEKDTPVLQWLFIFCCSNSQRSTKAFFLVKKYFFASKALMGTKSCYLQKDNGIQGPVEKNYRILKIYRLRDSNCSMHSTIRKDNSKHLLWVQKNGKSFMNS